MDTLEGVRAAEARFNVPADQRSDLATVGAITDPPLRSDPIRTSGTSCAPDRLTLWYRSRLYEHDGFYTVRLLGPSLPDQHVVAAPCLFEAGRAHLEPARGLAMGQ